MIFFLCHTNEHVRCLISIPFVLISYEMLYHQNISKSHDGIEEAPQAIDKMNAFSQLNIFDWNCFLLQERF